MLVYVLKKNLKNLTPNEEEIWKSYVQNIDRTDNKTSRPLNKKEVRSLKPANKRSVVKKSYFGGTQISNNHLLLDKKIHTKLKHGLLKPERKLDLHGLIYEKAQFHVKEFIYQAYHDEKRLILIVTGKSRKPLINESFFSDSRRGVINRSFPIWLESESLKHLILNVTTAHFSHGGDGAYYVYLRKKKL